MKHGHHHYRYLLWATLFVLSLVHGPLSAQEPAVDSHQWSQRYDPYFRTFAARYFGPHYDWRWFKAQAIAESSLDMEATSPSGARGIMQVLPSTYEDIRAEQPYFGTLDDAKWNVAAGIYYLAQLFRSWPGLPEQERLYLAFASYNAGYQRIRNAYRRVPDGKNARWEEVKAYVPAETRAYVERIRRLMEEQQQPLRLVQISPYD